MLLKIAMHREPGDPPATDLGYLLHKNPARVQVFEQGFGKVHLFYPEASDDRCEMAMLLDIDPVGLVRGRRSVPGLDQYVSDRPYVASSFLSVALNDVLGTAMHGRSRERPDLVDCPLSLRASIEVIGSRGGNGAELLHRLFEPLGYAVEAAAHPLDDLFPEWKTGHYYSLALTQRLPLQRLLQHLYVLIPVLDNDKHYWVGPDEVEKLLARGSEWLADHPERELITRRYLRYQRSLTRDALSRLVLVDDDETDPDAAAEQGDAEEADIERPLSLNAQRLGAVLAALRASGAASVLDLGCGEGNLLRDLIADSRFSRVVGVDVAMRALEKAADRLRLDRMPERQRQRLQLLHGSLIYRDERLEGFDAAVLVEVIEHFDPPRLRALERSVFEFARPRTVIVTTPNREYNAVWETLPAGAFRHRDHRFEWTRDEFSAWGCRVAEAHGYVVRMLAIGPSHPEFGSPTQMGVFSRDGA